MRVTDEDIECAQELIAAEPPRGDGRIMIVRDHLSNIIADLVDARTELAKNAIHTPSDADLIKHLQEEVAFAQRDLKDAQTRIQAHENVLDLFLQAVADQTVEDEHAELETLERLDDARTKALDEAADYLDSIGYMGAAGVRKLKWKDAKPTPEGAF